MQSIETQSLNFPSFSTSISIRLNANGVKEIFDPVRKKYVCLTPEEWVRQHAIRFLVEYQAVPLNLIIVEGTVSVGRLKQRFDLVVYNRSMQPSLLVECKAAHVAVAQKTFDQIARYAQALHICHLWITNGLQHYSFRYNASLQQYDFLSALPSFHDLNA